MKPDGLCLLFEDDKSLRVAMGTFSWTVSIWSILFWYWDRYSTFSEDYLLSTSLIVFFFTGSGNSTVDSELWKPRMREVTDEKGFQHLPRRLRAIYPFRQSPSAKSEQKKSVKKINVSAACYHGFFFHWFFLARATDSAEKDGLLLVFDILFWLSVGQLVGQSVCRSVFRSVGQSFGLPVSQ